MMLRVEVDDLTRPDVLALLEEARLRGLRQVTIETGSADLFTPARALYARRGFVECGPFGRYGPDPNSTFMTVAL